MLHKTAVLSDFGFQFLGPICSEYMHSLRDCILENSDSPIVFLAREGYFLKEIYEELTENQLIDNQESVYLLASRTFLFRICIADPFSWEYSCKHKFEGTIDALMSARFGFPHAVTKTIFSNDILNKTISLPADYAHLTTIFYKHLDVLNSAVATSRGNYRDYIGSLNVLSGGAPIFVDVGYSGTIQKLLTRLIGKNTLGLYFITTKQGEYSIGKSKATMTPVFKNGVQMGDGYPMLDRSLFLESLLTSPDGQFLDIHKLCNPLLKNEAFKPVYGRVSYAQANSEDLSAVFGGVKTAVSHYFRTGVRFSRTDIETLYETFTTSPHMIPCAMRPLFDVDDAISGNKNVNPLQLFGI